MTCGIYMIKNKKTGQIYIGQSINIERRWNFHYNNKKSYIDRAINKYGIDNFIFKIIEELPKDSLLLNEREEYWINYYDSYNNKQHYNLTPGGDFCPMKIPEIAQKMCGKNNPSYGGLSIEHRQKISNSMSGKKNPMYGVRRYGKDNPMYGVHRYGKDNPNTKYTIWDNLCCYYGKSKMFNKDREPNPCKCFVLKYKGYKITSFSFIDFISCEIIYNMILKFIGD